MTTTVAVDRAPDLAPKQAGKDGGEICEGREEEQLKRAEHSRYRRNDKIGKCTAALKYDTAESKEAEQDPPGWALGSTSCDIAVTTHFACCVLIDAGARFII